jgi:hypothetical protein
MYNINGRSKRKGADHGGYWVPWESCLQTFS